MIELIRGEKCMEQIWNGAIHRQKTVLKGLVYYSLSYCKVLVFFKLHFPLIFTNKFCNTIHYLRIFTVK